MEALFADWLFYFNFEQAIYTSTDVVQVNLAAATGDMGILANHVPTIEPLRAGVIEVVEGSGSKKWFGELSGLVYLPLEGAWF